MAILKNTVGHRPLIYHQDDLDCPVIANVDLLVIGGSQSGVAAAIACRRGMEYLGMDQPRILLVEQNNYLGGQSVTNMVSQWEIPAFRQNVGKWQIKGIGIEMVERIVELGGSDKLWEDLVDLQRQEDAEWPSLGQDRKIHGEEALNIEAIKFALMDMCIDDGIELLLDARVVAPIETTVNHDVDITSGLARLPGSILPEHVRSCAGGAIAEHFSGRGAILSKITIDASSNGLMCWWLAGKHGCTVDPPKHRGLTQSYVWIGGINMDEFLSWVRTLSDDVFEMYPSDPDQMQAHVDTGRLIWFKSKGMNKPREVFEAAEKQEGEQLDVLFKAGFTPVGFYMKWVGNYPGHGVFAVDGPYYREDSLDGATWTSEHVRNLYGSWGLFRIIRHMPGFEHAYLAKTCERMGLRTTRVPLGLYKIKGDDLKTNQEHPDAIGVADWHDRTDEGDTGKWGYHVPLRALIPREIDGLLYCGRAVSFDHGAMNAHRGIGTTIVCGQGAGVGAAVTLAMKTQPRFVDREKVQEILKHQQVVLDIPHL
ncbi:FAD-dependent oxidoreductase [Candidatus Bathyarchaeota archaeon]|nr:FAD-dependent oxidoreductase [Candidatus Bathyarchaeota archaeon]